MRATVDVRSASTDRSARDGRPHGYGDPCRSRFSKRVYSLRNASLTVPIGPLRCLPMMISAIALRSPWLSASYDLLAVDEHDDVGVLFERARFAQVGELRPMIGRALPARATQLRQRDDRDVQLLGQPLQRPRDRRQLLLAVLEAAAPLHQLNVVDDQQVQAVLGLEAARLGAHLEHADRRRVVDEDPRLGQRRRAPCDSRP